jgi:hypothetical protein
MLLALMDYLCIQLHIAWWTGANLTDTGTHSAEANSTCMGTDLIWQDQKDNLESEMLIVNPQPQQHTGVATQPPLLMTRLDLRLCMEWNTPSVIGRSKVPSQVFLEHILQGSEPCLNFQF